MFFEMSMDIFWTLLDGGWMCMDSRIHVIAWSDTCMGKMGTPMINALISLAYYALKVKMGVAVFFAAASPHSFSLASTLSGFYCMICFYGEGDDSVGCWVLSGISLMLGSLKWSINSDCFSLVSFGFYQMIW